MLSKVSLMGLSHTTLGVLGRTEILWVYFFPLFIVWTLVILP